MKKSIIPAAAAVFALATLFSCSPRNNADMVNTVYYMSPYIQVESSSADIDKYFEARIDFTDTREYNSSEANNDSLALRWFDTQLTNIDDETLIAFFTNQYDSCAISLHRTVIGNATESPAIARKVWTPEGAYYLSY